MIKFENLSNEATYQLRFLIYCGIDEELNRALKNKNIVEVKELKEIVTWYNKNILLSGKSLAEKLDLLEVSDKK